VLIADGHHLIRAGIAHLLGVYPDVEIVGEAVDGEDAIAQTRRHRPDIVLMDIRMPGIGGLEATQRIRRFSEDIRILILTAFPDDSYVQRLLDAGADGLLCKGAQHDEMITAIRDIFIKGHYISSEIAQRLVLSLRDASSDPFALLSQREFQVAMMVVNCHKVADIAERIFLSPKTVNTYRYRIFDKLNVTSDVELTHLALRHGLVDAFPHTR
jgi:two-component system invasion response regulator UvrY